MILISFGGCSARDRIFIIGVFGSETASSETIQGFKQGMVELSYVEGKDIKYIHKSFNEQDEQGIDAGIRQIMEQDPDLLFTIGRGGALHARRLVEGTDLPVLFCGDACREKNGQAGATNISGDQTV